MYPKSAVIITGDLYEYNSEIFVGILFIVVSICVESCFDDSEIFTATPIY